MGLLRKSLRAMKKWPTPIWVALLGLCGVIAVAIINNVVPLFRTSSPTTDQKISDSSGAEQVGQDKTTVDGDRNNVQVGSNTFSNSGIIGNSNSVNIASSIKVDQANSPTVLVVENNSGNIANVKDSPGASVNQSIVNTEPQPKIFEIITRSINIETNLSDGQIAYESRFHLRVSNPPKDPVLHYSCSKVHLLSLTSTPIGFMGNPNPTYLGLLVICLTQERVQQSDFNFEILSAQNITR